MSKLVYTAAALNGLRAVVALAFGAKLHPDTDLYAQGSLGLYPSPLGRLAGVGGFWMLSAVNVVACVVLVVLVAKLAHEWWGSPTLAAWICLLTPLTFWTIFPGVDTIGACFVVGAALVWTRRRRALALVQTVLGLLAHTAVGPLAVFAVATYAPSWRVRLAVTGGLTALCVLVLAVTPYGGVVDAVGYPWHAVRVGCKTALIALLAFVPFVYRLGVDRMRTRILVVALVGTSAAAALQSAEHTSNSRYALPFVALASAAVAVPRRVA